MTIHLKDEIRFLGELIITAQKIKGDNMSNPINTTAGMNAQEDLDQKIESLIDYMKQLKNDFIKKQARVQRHAHELNCRIEDALNFNKNVRVVPEEMNN